MKTFFEVTNNWHQQELIELDDIRSVTPARNPQQTLIRKKSGGYVVAEANFVEIKRQLKASGQVEIV